MNTVSFTVGGEKVLIDEDDLLLVADYHWNLLRVPTSNMCYVISRTGNVTTYLHRLILNTPKNRETDHINLNGLDNRKSNLRICTRQENARNTGRLRNNKSGFKGVTRHQNNWRSTCTYNKRHIHLGSFDTPEEAYLMYLFTIVELHGEFARPE